MASKKYSFLFLLFATLVFTILYVGGVSAIDIYSTNPNAQIYVTSNSNVTVQTYNQTWLDFNGVSSRMYLPSNIQMNPGNFTLSFWVKLTQDNNPDIVYLYSDGNYIYPGNISIIYRYTNARVTASIATNYTFGTFSLNDTKWHNIYLTYKKNEYGLFYVDNNLLGTFDTYKGANETVPTTGYNKTFGIATNDTSKSMNGSISEIYLYNTSLKSNQIRALKNISVFGNNLGGVIFNAVIHDVDDNRGGTQTQYMTLSNFNSSIKELVNRGYKFVTFNDINQWSKGKLYLPEKSIGISFDDGHISTFSNASKVLDVYGINATYGVITGLVGTSNFLSWSNVSLMIAKGNEICSHAINATVITSFSTEDAIKAFNQSRWDIYYNTSYMPTCFIFPGGQSNSSLLDMCLQYYSICQTDNADIPGASFDNQFFIGSYKTDDLTRHIKRLAIYNTTTVDEFLRLDLYSNIIARLGFKESKGNNLYDSVNSFNGTIVGATWNNDTIQVSNTLNPILSLDNGLLRSPSYLFYSMLLGKTQPVVSYTLLNNTGSEAYPLQIYNITNAKIELSNGTTLYNLNTSYNITIASGSYLYIYNDYVNEDAQIQGICTDAGNTFLESVALIGILITVVLIASVLGLLFASYQGLINLGGLSGSFDMESVLGFVLTVLLTGLILATVTFVVVGKYCPAIGG